MKFRLFPSFSKPNKLAHKRRKSLHLEALEDRKMNIAGPNAPIGGGFDPGWVIYDPPAQTVGTIDFNNQTGVVTINGTDSTYDDVKITIDNKNTSSPLDDLITISLRNLGPAITKQFNQYTQGANTGVTSIIFNGLGQPDTFDNQTGVPSTVNGGAGKDTLLGGWGADQFFAGDGDDWMDGRSGNDILWGDAGSDWLFGDAGNDQLHGGAQNDFLYGGLDADSLWGDDGNDLIEGGPGKNTVLNGGLGADTFQQFSSSTKVTALMAHDFNKNQGDLAFSSYSTMGWFDNTLVDPMIRSLIREDYRDSSITRTETLDIYKQVQKDGWVYSGELNDLKNIDASLLVMSSDVRNLSGKIAFGDPANAFYQNSTLGNLKANDSAGKLQLLVNKWFLGLDRPVAEAGTTYQYVFGQLFVNGPHFSDVDQGAVGDCYFLAGLAETARVSPNAITNMFTDNGDGTFTVRFFNNGRYDFVTVDRYLPIKSNGYSPYAGFGSTYHGVGNELWVALAEKAYAQINASGWIGQDNTNTYEGISSGKAEVAYAQITGKSATLSSLTSESAVIGAFNAGRAVEFNTKVSGIPSHIVTNHTYALINYDPATKKFLLFNPWGYGSSKPGEISVTWNELKSYFNGWMNGVV